MSDDPEVTALLDWLQARRRHVAEQFLAVPAAARGASRVPSGWTPRGLLRHLALDVERFWLRAVVAGEPVPLSQGYDGWTAPEEQTDDDLLAQYVEECRLGTAAVKGRRAADAPLWWPADSGPPLHATLRDVLLHVLVETATHAGHLDVSRELVDGGRRLVLDEPPDPASG